MNANIMWQNSLNLNQKALLLSEFTDRSTTLSPENSTADPARVRLSLKMIEEETALVKNSSIYVKESVMYTGSENE